MFKEQLFNYRFRILFLTFIIYFLLSPIVAETPLGKSLFEIFYMFIMLSAVYTVSDQKILFLITSVVIILGIVFSWFAVIGENSTLFLTSNIIEILVLSVIVYTILSYVLHIDITSTDHIFGAVCCYLLIGFVWGFVFDSIGIIIPHSFHIDHPTNLTLIQQLPEMIYYSFVTLTTLGYGDITATNMIAKSFSAVEAIIGQIFLVVLIASLVGAYTADHRRKHG